MRQATRRVWGSASVLFCSLIELWARCWIAVTGFCHNLLEWSSSHQVVSVLVREDLISVSVSLVVSVFVPVLVPVHVWVPHYNFYLYHTWLCKTSDKVSHKTYNFVNHAFVFIFFTLVQFLIWLSRNHPSPCHLNARNSRTRWRMTCKWAKGKRLQLAGKLSIVSYFCTSV
jgi:hypothetical protein